MKSPNFRSGLFFLNILVNSSSVFLCAHNEAGMVFDQILAIVKATKLTRKKYKNDFAYLTGKATSAIYIDRSMMRICSRQFLILAFRMKILLWLETTTVHCDWSQPQFTVAKSHTI